MNARTVRLLTAAAISLATFAVMALSIQDTREWARDGKGLGDQLTLTTDGLFDTHVIAFEVLGILLTAAMIGALVIARPLGQAPDEANYDPPTPEQLEASQRQAAPEAHKGVGK